MAHPTSDTAKHLRRKGEARVTKAWPLSPTPHPGPRAQRRAVPGHRQLEWKNTVPSARPGGIQSVLLGLLLGTWEPLEVTQPGQGDLEDLTIIENRDGGQFWGCVESL